MIDTTMVLAFIIGVVTIPIVLGAVAWERTFNLKMTWWKWLLAALWYILLSFTFAGSFTLLGEKEPGAWAKFLGFHLIITVIFGAVVWFLI